MIAYVFQGAFLCEDCALPLFRGLQDREHEDTGCSDAYPQGPYADGGGEGDSPQHCDSCGVFPENPLTEDGESYVRGEAESDSGAFLANRGVWKTWREFYAYLWARED